MLESWVGRRQITSDVHFYVAEWQRISSYGAFTKAMSPRVLSKLSSLCLLLAMVLTCSFSQDAPRGSLLACMQEFITFFFMCHLLCSAYSSEFSWPRSPRWRRVLLIFTGFGLFSALASTASEVVKKRHGQDKQIAQAELNRDIAKLGLEIKRAASGRPTRDEIQRLEAQLKDIRARKEQLDQG
jgi:hypothetical protein